METPTIWYAIRILKFDDFENEWSELTEHLAMNGYTYDTNGDATLFVYDEEFAYVMTIIEDRGLMYEVL